MQRAVPARPVSRAWRVSPCGDEQQPARTVANNGARIFIGVLVVGFSGLKQGPWRGSLHAPVSGNSSKEKQVPLHEACPVPWCSNRRRCNSRYAPISMDDNGALSMPPTIGAAMRCMTSEPAPPPIISRSAGQDYRYRHRLQAHTLHRTFAVGRIVGFAGFGIRGQLPLRRDADTAA